MGWNIWAGLLRGPMLESIVKDVEKVSEYILSYLSPKGLNHHLAAFEYWIWRVGRKTNDSRGKRFWRDEEMFGRLRIVAMRDRHNCNEMHCSCSNRTPSINRISVSSYVEVIFSENDEWKWESVSGEQWNCRCSNRTKSINWILYLQLGIYVGHFQPILQAKIGMEKIRISPRWKIFLT